MYFLSEKEKIACSLQEDKIMFFMLRIISLLFQLNQSQATKKWAAAEEKQKESVRSIRKKPAKQISAILHSGVVHYCGKLLIIMPAGVFNKLWTDSTDHHSQDQ